MKGAPYFSHDANARDDEKILGLRMKHGWEGYGLYWAIIEKLRANTDFRLSTNFNLLGYDLRVSNDLIKSIVSGFGLFTIEGDQFYSQSLCERMKLKEAKSDIARKNATSKWNGDPAQTSKQSRSERLTAARLKGTHTKQQWQEMREFFSRCVKCGTHEDIVKDHIIPLYQGGSDGIENLQPLCRTCNGAKGPENVDFRVGFCERNACEMPAEWLQAASEMPPLKERKESKGKKEGDTHAQEAPPLQPGIPPKPPLPEPDPSNYSRPKSAPDFQAVHECFYRLGKPDEAKGFFDYYEGLNWHKGNTPIINWQSFANRWVTGDRPAKAAPRPSSESIITIKKKLL